MNDNKRRNNDQHSKIESSQEISGLEKIISDIRKKKLPETEKESMIDEVTRLYQNFLNRIDKKQFDTGSYLREIREKTKVSLSDTANALGISKSYLSEIENNIKLPSDYLIRQLALHYKLDEGDLFNKFGKTPTLAAEQLAEMPGLQIVLAKIRLKKNLTEEQKQAMNDSVEQFYKDFIDSLGINK